MHFILFLTSLMSVTSTLAAPIPRRSLVTRTAPSDNAVEKRTPTTWYHPRAHPVHRLFRRQDDSDSDYDFDDEGADNGEYKYDEELSSDDVEFPEVGTPEWSEGFPEDIPDPKDMPKAWKDALDRAVKAKKIPNIPKSTYNADASPAIEYPKGTDPESPEVCSSTFKCRAPGSLWDAPEGYFGTSFDDGPSPATETLLDFLEENEEKATHFMIGTNILKYPELFKRAFAAENDIASHTYSHRAMTSLTNLEVVAELGWTLQLIHNSTGGRVPRFWRPPFGDSDTRVQAIAHEVFGLRTVIWNQDTDDWAMTTGAKSKQEVTDTFNGFVDLPKSPGLVVLEHESTEETVQQFIQAYPKLIDAGWKLLPLTQLYEGLHVYQNAVEDEVTPHGIVHLDTDAADDLTAEVGPSAKAKDNGAVSLGASPILFVAAVLGMLVL